MLLSKKQTKKLAGIGMAFAVLAASVSGSIISEPATVHANALGDWLNSLDKEPSSSDNTDNEGNKVDGRAYITYRCSNAKVKISNGSDSAPVNAKSFLKFTIRAEFSDTDAGSTVYYQVVDNGDSYDSGAWKRAVPTTKGLLTKKDFQFALKKTLSNKVVYIKSTCEDRNTIVKTVPFNLDLDKPSISGVKNRVTYTRNVTIKFSDALSGVKSAKLNGAKIINGKTITENGKYKLVVTDNAGNAKTLRFTIDK